MRNVLNIILYQYLVGTATVGMIVMIFCILQRLDITFNHLKVTTISNISEDRQLSKIFFRGDERIYI